LYLNLMTSESSTHHHILLHEVFSRAPRNTSPHSLRNLAPASMSLSLILFFP
jgi:hypothetical protein